MPKLNMNSFFVCLCWDNVGRVLAHFFLQLAYVASDFDTNSYGESWDSSCENSRVPVQNQWVPFKKKGVRNWKCLGCYVHVTRQLIWRQTPKLCITVYLVLLFYTTTKAKRNMHHQTTAIIKLMQQKLHERDISTNTQILIEWSIFASYGTHAMNNCHYFASLGIFMCQGHRTQKKIGNNITT